MDFVLCFFQGSSSGCGRQALWDVARGLLNNKAAVVHLFWSFVEFQCNCFGQDERGAVRLFRCQQPTDTQRRTQRTSYLWQLPSKLLDLSAAWCPLPRNRPKEITLRLMIQLFNIASSSKHTSIWCIPYCCCGKHFPICSYCWALQVKCMSQQECA